MTESEAVKIMYSIDNADEMDEELCEAYNMAINALEKLEKIKEIISNSNQWSKEDVVVKAQAFCDIEKIVRRDVE